ncbi:MAG: trypsin-like peptidase domain-containing protein [Candidatus Eremiobacteraeota bacterium]|nr:trypsin-like peptidase domain-containing protein [Candidatus Eremiobacteraeota bacterium]
MILRVVSTIALATLIDVLGCERNADDAFVASVQRLRPAVVLLSMRVPPENKKARYDDAYATGFVVASGAWGSDILTVRHAIDGAWDLQVTVGNRRRAPAGVIASNDDLDLALLRTPHANLPVLSLGSSAHLQHEVGREVGLLGYPIPDEFDDEGLGLATSLDSGRLSSIRKDALEVTLSIVPGESGAPVFIADTGEIVGVAESRFDDERSIGFALPVDEVKRFLHHVDSHHGF